MCTEAGVHLTVMLGKFPNSGDDSLNGRCGVPQQAGRVKCALFLSASQGGGTLNYQRRIGVAGQ
ncbi:hypothetical protein FHT77_004450 [Rhizobium sp. BK181]|nr:hypothetical protein [Rhizobium sp. BK181]